MSGKWKNDTWFGIASKVGTQILIGGVESLSGIFINLNNPSKRHTFEITSSRFGIGFGWDAGLIAIFVFNSNELYWLDGQRLDDWGANVALGPNLGPIIKGLTDHNLLPAIKVVRESAIQLIQNIDSIRNVASFVENACFSDATVEHPMLSLELPGPSGGEELSIFKSYGTIYIDN